MNGGSRAAERAKLVELLAVYEEGRVIHLEEDERGFLERETTAERIFRVRERIAEIEEYNRRDAENA